MKNHPKDLGKGQRFVEFGKRVFVGGVDYEKMAKMGQCHLRLKYGYVLKFLDVVEREGASGRVTVVEGEYVDGTLGGVGMKEVKSIVHWVGGGEEEEEGGCRCQVEVRNYGRLFQDEDEDEEEAEANPDAEAEANKFLASLNTNSLSITSNVVVEKSVIDEARAHIEKIGNNPNPPTKLYASDLRFQFERIGYFALDSSSTNDKLVFNRVVELRGEKRKEENKKIGETGVRKRGMGGGGGGGGNKGGGVERDEACRVAFKYATIRTVAAHPSSDKLVVLSVNCGDTDTDTDNDNDNDTDNDTDNDNNDRQIVATVSEETRDKLEGRRVIVCTNLKQAKIAGVESNGMLMKLLDEGTSGGANGELALFQGVNDADAATRGIPDECLKSKGAVKVFERTVARIFEGDTAEKSSLLVEISKRSCS